MFEADTAIHILISSAAFVGWGWFTWLQGVKKAVEVALKHTLVTRNLTTHELKCLKDEVIKELKQ